MHNQHKLLRVLQLITILQAKPSKSIRQLARMLSCTDRTAYRYLDLLKAAGFKVEKDNFQRFFLDGDLQSQSTSFTPEETMLLRELVQSAAGKSPLRDSLLKKLYVMGDPDLQAGNILKAHLAGIVEKISKAIQDRKVVVLKRYFSANSQQVHDRRVEPVKFTDNYTSLVAYEPSSGKNKYFNLERISAVELTRSRMEHEDRHRFLRPDIFGFGEKPKRYHLTMWMTLRAWLYLKDQYPMALRYVKFDKAKNKYRLQADVFSKAPARRFADGLAGEVEVKWG